MTWVPLPLQRLAVGQVVPVDVVSPQGRLLLRRGQALANEDHRAMLAAHHAQISESDAQAWEKASARWWRNHPQATPGLAPHQAPLPPEILDADYLDGRPVAGGWLDVQEVLRSLLYLGLDADQPVARLEGIEQRMLQLLAHDADDALFVLFQALGDLNLGYCATHALLAGTVGWLAVRKRPDAPVDAALLLRATLTMNLGMARPQDSLSRQHKPPNAAQRLIIEQHPPTSADMLTQLGLHDDALLALVQHHHQPQRASQDLGLQPVLPLLHLTDTLVAKLAPRASRPALSALEATRHLLQQPPAPGDWGPALASVLGFYPPGTWVKLANGETAVVIQRGRRAHTPHVASVTDGAGLPLARYLYRSTDVERSHPHAVAAALRGDAVPIRVNRDKVHRIRVQQGLTPDQMFPLRAVLSTP